MTPDLITLAIDGSVEKLAELYEDPESGLTAENISVLNKRAKNGKSPLDMAAMLGHVEFLEELLVRGANVNNPTKRGYSPLHHAASWGHVDCLKVLIDKGADLQLKTLHGERAREVANRYKQMGCVEFLDKAEAKESLRNFIAMIKDTIADPEKNLGRFTRDDRVTGNKACDEKTEWLDTNGDEVTIEEIYSQKAQLEEFVQPMLSKLEDPDWVDTPRSSKPHSKGK